MEKSIILDILSPSWNYQYLGINCFNHKTIKIPVKGLKETKTVLSKMECCSYLVSPANNIIMYHSRLHHLLKYFFMNARGNRIFLLHKIQYIMCNNLLIKQCTLVISVHLTVTETSDIHSVFVRLIKKTGCTMWVQSKGKVISKNGKKFCIVFTHSLFP